MQGCCLTGAQLPVAPTISSRATKILNKEPAWVPKNYDSSDNSLCAHFQWRNDRIPACSFGTFETNMFVNVDCRQKIYAAKSKQTLKHSTGNSELEQIKFRDKWMEFWVSMYFICLPFQSVGS